MKRQHKQKFDVTLPRTFVSKEFISELLAAIPRSIRGDYLKSELLSKFNGPGTSSAELRKRRAIVKWRSVERNNSLTNQRLLLSEVDFGWTSSDVFFEEVRRFTGRILGPLPYPEVLHLSVLGNGASVGVTRSPMAAITKLGGEAVCSTSALKHWFALASGTVLSNQTLVTEESSRLFTVPKNSEIDRPAAKEPACNMLLQRSVGIYIRKRLKRFGIDLLDQSRNQRLAKEAVDRGLATIDLSSASDSITHQLVLNCIPFDWYSLLDDLRVRSTLIEGSSHELEMFSSMGNGFTFELESLLFYAITRVALQLSGLKGIVSVYGDDIIAPSVVVPRLRRLLSFLGFKMNPKKTNYRGSFRESCGSHWYNGFDIKPFYVRRPVDTLPDLINILNRMFMWDSHGECDFFFTPALAELHRKYSRFVPSVLYGGTSAEDPHALVTGHRPRKRLVPLTKDIEITEDLEQPALNLWHLVKSRNPNEIVEVKPRRDIAFKVRRNVGSFGTVTTNPYLILGEG